tara:strand:+ start:3641 stop:3787 length:147 start_codon:yes stop_codon:yes gene_type:complete
MQKQIVVKEDKIKTVKYICPACQMVEEDVDIAGSKYSAFSGIEDLNEV